MRSHRTSIGHSNPAGAVRIGGLCAEPHSREAIGCFRCGVSHTRRRGGILIVAMVCMLLATMILGAMLKLTMMHGRQMRTEQYSVQADWLAVSAVERAASRLFDDRSYSGEVWEIEAGLIGGVYDGRAEIRVTPSAEDQDEYSVTVVAVYPLHSPQPMRRTKTVSIRMTSQP